MKTIVLSSLVKVFKDSNLNHKEYTSASCLKNEKFSYQIAVIPSCEDGKELNISVSSPLTISFNIFLTQLCIKQGNEKEDEYLQVAVKEVINPSYDITIINLRD
ncbi:MAG: hypothetical protein J6A43_05760, partial [Clostridia bacterium]|nr:hypothetical protein [Clostridia bacterium]